MPPLVTIVGRPNVGKSTLFNRLIRDRRALVDGSPGVTRDRIYGQVEYGGRSFRLADTGGLDLEDTENIISGIRDQAIAALNEANLVLFVVDVRGGLSPVDAEIAAYLRRYDKPMMLVLNKVDTRKQQPLAAEFSALGFEHTALVSAEHGEGIGELLDMVVRHLPEEAEPPLIEPGMQVAIIGRPNVGKSSILNAILGTGRMIVNDAAGTTRDVIDVTTEINGHRFTFLDTAGIRRKANITVRMEVISSIKARETIGRADCCILVLDARQGLTAQDKALAGMVDSDGRGAIIALNKWDLKQAEFQAGEEGDRFIKDLREAIKSIRYAPIVSTCALTGMRVPKLMEKLLQVGANQQRIIPPAELKAFVEELVRLYPIQSSGGKVTAIHRIVQLTAAPARFRIFVRGFVPENYLRFMERQMRGAYDLEGVPVHFAIVRV
jgi:GTPase